MLAHHFLHRYAGLSGQPIHGFVPATMVALQGYRWPGNVRELENAIERAVSLSHGPLLLPEDLPEQIREAEVADQPVHDEGLLSIEEMEKRYLVRVFRETGGNMARAAKILGIDRRTL